MKAVNWGVTHHEEAVCIYSNGMKGIYVIRIKSHLSCVLSEPLPEEAGIVQS